MSILDSLFSRVSRPAGRALDPTIRDIVHAVLREHGYASPAEVQALRDEVRDMRARVDAMQRRVEEVVARAEGVRAEVLAEADARAAVAAEKLAALQAQVAAARAPSPAADAPPRASGAVAATPAPGGACRVDGCEGAVRSKGFCSSHYQQWRRGTLREFVGPEGHVVVGGKNFQVSQALAGGRAEIRGGKLFVDGAQA